MCTMNWPKEKVLEFIDEVRANPSLWDSDAADYRDRQGKKDGWQAVGLRFGIGAEEAYKKFRSLRTYAKNEVKKKSAAGKRSTWFAYDAISFILCRGGGDSSSSDAFQHHGAMEVEGTTYSCDPEYVPHTSLYSQLAAKRRRKRKYEEEEEIDEEEEEVHVAPSVSVSAAVHAGPPPPPPPAPVPPAPVQLPVHQGIHIIKEASDGGRTRNAHSAFGEHVANKMASYSDHVRSEVELKISQVLYEADRKMFDLRESGCQCALICYDSDDKGGGHKS